MCRDLIPQNKLLFPPYLFHPIAFETFLKDRLEHLFRNALNLEKESLNLKVIAPSKEEARLCLQTNHTLRAKLEIRWSGSFLDSTTLRLQQILFFDDFLKFFEEMGQSYAFSSFFASFSNLSVLISWFPTIQRGLPASTLSL